jgi:hypothetical protein
MRERLQQLRRAGGAAEAVAEGERLPFGEFRPMNAGLTSRAIDDLMTHAV